jgi:hypothetical protein
MIGGYGAAAFRKCTCRASRPVVEGGGQRSQVKQPLSLKMYACTFFLRIRYYYTTRFIYFSA